MAKKGYLYFIDDGDNHIKIGVTDNLERRKRQLQTGNAQELKLVHSVNLMSMSDAYGLEVLLHHRMQKYKVNGEWFRKRPVMKFLKHYWIHVGPYRFKGIGYPIWKIFLFVSLVIFMIIILESGWCFVH